MIDREREAAKRLQELDELKNDFVGMVAHDLRSPMTVISGFADFLRNHLDSLSSDETALYLQRISDNTKHLAAFIEDVLQVARIEAGEIVIDLTEFDLGALMRKTVDELVMSHPGRHITLDIDHNLSSAIGDQARQWQIIHNLVNNALKFSEPSDGPVEVSVGNNDGGLTVTVTDHGVGIEPANLSRVFDKFSGRAASNRSNVSGTGLGLYICKSLVEAQQGVISVTSDRKTGTSFTYTIPATSSNSQAEAAS